MKRRTNLALAAAAGVGLAFAARDIARRKARIDFRTKSVVITGARGLALVIARQLAEEGARLALLARDPEELENAEQDLRGLDAEVMVLSCDVGDQAQVEQSLALVLRRYARIDVLINIAGIIQVGPLENMRLQDYEEAMAIHFWGPLYSMNAVIPTMRQQGGGRIINVASIGGVVAVPHLAPYVASKFALVGLSDVYRAELAKDNIRVTTVIPGLMRAGSHVNALFKGRNRQEYAWFSILNAQFFTSIDARKAAAQIIEACRKANPGYPLRRSQFSPTGWWSRIMRWQQEIIHVS